MRVTLNGYVIADEYTRLYRFFGYNCFSPADVRKALADNPKGETLTLEVNSPGGMVQAGSEMYSVLRAPRPGVRVAAEVQSLSASASSYMMLGCDRVMMSPVAQVMIHLPALATEGDRIEHEKSMGQLHAAEESILNAYELRCRGRSTRDQLRAMMESETWLCAQDAVNAGLADGILYQDGEQPLSIPPTMINAVGGGIRAMACSGAGLPSPTDLMARYQQLVDEGKAPADPLAPTPPAAADHKEFDAPKALKDDWRNSARLSLARAKIY